MIYSKGDILKVKTLNGKYRSNVSNPYLVEVISDDKDFLITKIPIIGYHQRSFNKNTDEWINGHRFRFEKVGHTSESFWYKKLISQHIS